MATANTKRGYFGRCLLLLIGAAGIACSAFVTVSCEFIGVEDVDVDEVFPDSLYLNTIGIFRYSSALETCAEYEKQFWHSSFNELFVTSQISSIVAPVLGMLAWLLVFSEVICCQFYGGFVLQNLLFLAAFAAQSCTFFIFGQTQFCFYDNAIHCEWKIGSILSISAAAMYYICSILLCCMPRPNPCIGNGNDGDNRNNAGDVEKAAGTEDERHSDSDHTTEH